jgi:hypothetical protein
MERNGVGVGGRLGRIHRRSRKRIKGKERITCCSLSHDVESFSKFWGRAY